MAETSRLQRFATFLALLNVLLSGHSREGDLFCHVTAWTG